MTVGSLPARDAGRITAPTLTRDDVLRIVQSLAGAQRRARRSVSEASLFMPVRGVADFSPEEAKALARAAVRFFDLDSGEAELVRRLLFLAEFEAWAALLYKCWKRETLSFHSSGSTGVPVRNRHTLVSMAEEAAMVAPFFASRRRIVTVMPAHHIFGLMHSLWLAKWLDAPVVHMPPLPTAGFFESLRDGDVVMAFPFFWQSLLAVTRQRTGEDAFRLPPDVMGVTATSPCPPRVISGLLDPGPDGVPLLVGMKEIYGSSETNGIGIRHDGEEWYELYAIWDPVILEDGTRMLRRPGAWAGPSGDALMPLPDVLVWHPENPRAFRPERRMDTAVQVAGVNVYPEEVAAVLRTHPLVRDCAVRLMRPEEGSRLKAFIVPGCPLDKAASHFGKEFRAWMAERLDAPRRPKHVRLGAVIPVNAMGKASDWD